MKSKAAMTLDRLLSRYGVASRSAAREMIEAGRVRVNGIVQRDPEHWVNRASDKVQLDGERLRPERKNYLLFYKPRGVIVSHGDPDGRKTIYDYLGQYVGNDDRPGGAAGTSRPRAPSSRPSGASAMAAPRGGWLSPVGRLDKDTSGLLLVTNDTEFAHFVTNPRSKVPKTYPVKVSGLVDDGIVARLAGGITMNRGDEARPISVRRLEDRGKYTWLEVVLSEGKNREVRRMIETVGFKVLKLVRTAIGSLTLAGLEVGKWRTLSSAEVSSLKGGSGVRARGSGPEPAGTA
jgi:23S rRNA pseudouridine2605 synthase